MFAGDIGQQIELVEIDEAVHDDIVDRAAPHLAAWLKHKVGATWRAKVG